MKIRVTYDYHETHYVEMTPHHSNLYGDERPSLRTLLRDYREYPVYVNYELAYNFTCKIKMDLVIDHIVHFWGVSSVKVIE